MSLIRLTSRGLYCEQADVYIDPKRKVERALITHAHADHAIPGHRYYLCTTQTLPLLRHHLGKAPVIEGLPYSQACVINGVRFSFHPAGHVYGSAQIRVEYKGEIWVVSGDYKLENDGVSEPFEPVPCHVFITESTFGIPRFRWKPQEDIFAEIHRWWERNREANRLSILLAYPLGKSQHLLRHLDQSHGPVLTYQQTEQINQVIRHNGTPLPSSLPLSKQISEDRLQQAILIAPPSIRRSSWLYKQKDYALAMVSGWIALKKNMQPGLFGDNGFALSDHADFPSLLKAVQSTGAGKVLVTHGYSMEFARTLQETGIEAKEITG